MDHGIAVISPVSYTHLEWNFCYAENLTAPFTDWDTLTVPGFIQMQSLQKPGQPYGAPHYVNTQYPWDGHEKLHPGQIDVYKRQLLHRTNTLP